MGGTEEDGSRLMDSTEVLMSSSVERREVESRSDLKFLPSEIDVWFDDPQSMR